MTLDTSFPISKPSYLLWIMVITRLPMSYTFIHLGEDWIRQYLKLCNNAECKGPQWRDSILIKIGIVIGCSKKFPEWSLDVSRASTSSYCFPELAVDCLANRLEYFILTVIIFYNNYLKCLYVYCRIHSVVLFGDVQRYFYLRSENISYLQQKNPLLVLYFISTYKVGYILNLPKFQKTNQKKKKK